MLFLFYFIIYDLLTVLVSSSVLKSLDPTKQKQLENDRNASGGAIRASSGRAAPVTKTTKSTTSVRPRASSTQSEDGASR